MPALIQSAPSRFAFKAPQGECRFQQKNPFGCAVWAIGRLRRARRKNRIRRARWRICCPLGRRLASKKGPNSGRWTIQAVGLLNGRIGVFADVRALGWRPNSALHYPPCTASFSIEGVDGRVKFGSRSRGNLTGENRTGKLMTGSPFSSPLGDLGLTGPIRPRDPTDRGGSVPSMREHRRLQIDTETDQNRSADHQRQHDLCPEHARPRPDIAAAG